MRNHRFIIFSYFVLLFVSFCLTADAQNFPSSLDTTSVFPRHDEFVATYLTSSLSSGATTMTVASTAAFASEPYILQIDQEQVLAIKATGTTFTITRGFNGTTAATHVPLTTARSAWSGYGWNRARSVLLNVEAKLGTGSSTPTTSGNILCVTGAGATTWESPATCGISGGGGGGSVASDSIWTTKGDLAAGTGLATAARLGAGANDTFLIADSAQTTGLKWGNAATARTALGLGTLATQSGTFSGTSSGTNTGDQTTISGNAGTATALAVNPADCSANQYATTIAANGDLTCAQVSSGQVTGLGSMATQSSGSVAISGGTVQVNNAGLQQVDLGGTNKLVIKANETLTGTRTLNLITNDADRTLTIAGTASVSGTSSGTNTGDVAAASTTDQLTGTDATKTATSDSVSALWEQGSDVASAGIVSLGEGGYFFITGTVTITDIDFATDKAGRMAHVKFAGILTLTHNSSTLILPGGANITTAAGDTMTIRSEGSDIIRVVQYTRAATPPPSGTNTGDQTITLTGDVTGTGTSSFATTIGANKVTTTTINANAATLAKLDASNATANKMLLSGASASPTWSTSTIPTSAGATANKVLLSDGTNYVLSTPAFPNASAASGKTIRSDGTNWIASTATLSDAPTTALKWLRSDGTNWITSTSTLSDTPSTAGKVLTSDGTNWIASTPTFPNASATSGKYIKSDGTNWIASTGSASGVGTCTNQVATVLNSDSAPTCASITNAMLGSTSYSQGTFVATCSGTATSSATLFLFPIGQVSAFTCTITAATSGIPMPAAGHLKNLTFVAGTAGKAGDAVTILKGGSATGMPTCVYGAGTTCSDVSTSGTVAAGDLITVKIVTTTTDTTANVQVSFQLWN